MAVSRVKTWVVEVLTAADLNGEFNNILNNGEDLAWPATKAKDLNGNELTLDADADSSFTVDTDDRLDLELAGVDLFRWDGTVTSPVNGMDYIAAATTFRPRIDAVGTDTNIGLEFRPKGTGIVVLADQNGNEVLSMGQGTTSAVNELTITNAATGNDPVLSATGGDTNIGLDIQTKGTGALLLTTNGSERAQIDSNGTLFVGDTLNANMTIGITVNGAGNDDQYFCLKSSDIATGLTTIPLQDVETDDFFTISKETDVNGGIKMQALGEDAAQTSVLRIDAIGGTADTDDIITSRALVEIFATEHDGSNALINAPANQNAFAVRTQAAGVRATRMLIKGDDGELHVSNTTLVAFDDEDDIMRTRELQTVMTAERGIIRTSYDLPVYNHETLHQLGLIGKKDEAGQFLIRIQPILGLLMGSVWQLYNIIRDTEKRLAATEQKLAALPAS